MKKLAFMLFAAALAAGSAQADMAPLSPEFLKWREEQAKIRVAGEDTGTARNYGVRPSPLNLAHLAENPVRVAAQPVSFDLRSLDVVPSVRDQASWGTCWDFAITAVIEINYLMQVMGQGTDKYITSAVSGAGATSKDVDLSEMHLAWFCFMAPRMEQRFTVNEAKDKFNPTGNEVMNTGAFSVVPMAILAHGKNWGPVAESAMPYIGTALKYSKVARQLGYDPEDLTREQIARVDARMAELTNEYCKTNLSGKTPADYPSLLRLKEAAYTASVFTLGKKEDGNMKKLFKGNRDAIKQLLRDKGALYVGYNAGGTINDNRAYYYTGDDANHAVALIGWDDNYAVENFTADKFGKKPSGNGAWLIRNSWGEDDGKCYFWMSYEQDISFGTAISMAPADELKAYTHSDLGWCADWGMGNDNTTFYGASVFRVGSSGGTLKEIGFYTTDNNASVELSVYVYDTKPTADTLTSGQTAARTVAANVPYAGYHTVTLDSDLALKAGQYFSVVQKAVNPQYAYPIAVTAKLESWTNFAEMHDGEGFTSDNGTTWVDGITMKDNDGNSQPVTPCIIAFMAGTAADDYGKETSALLTIDGIKVETLESWERDLNVSGDINEALNPNIPAGRKFTLTFGGTDGKPVAEGQKYTVYLMYTENALYGESYGSSEKGVRMPSGDVLPLYPAGHKPDLFLSYKICDGLDVDLPLYGPFEVTTASGGKATIDVDALTYADMGENAKAGEAANIATGHHTLLYFSQVDGGAGGPIDGLEVTAVDSTPTSNSTGHSGCDTLWGTSAGLGCLAFLALAGGALKLRRGAR